MVALFRLRAHGDAVALVMKHRHVPFREALAFVAGDRTIPGARPSQPSAANRPAHPPTLVAPPEYADPAHLGRRAALLAEDASARLWTPEGAGALQYLRHRGLNDDTIRRARLGWTPGIPALKLDEPGPSRFRGVTIPWYDGDRLQLLKVRQPGARWPRYAEVFRRRPRMYPGPALAPGPFNGTVVIVEGELDALLLGQELRGMADVITLGSASARPSAEILREFDGALRMFVATDADEAGDRLRGPVAPPCGARPASRAAQGLDRGVRGRARPAVVLDAAAAPRGPRPGRARVRREAADSPGGELTQAALAMPPDTVATPPEASPPGTPREIPIERRIALERGDALRAAGLALPLCWLPEPQEKWVQPPMPGKRDDGKLWFE